MPVKAINSYEQFQSVLEAGRPFVVDFWATWCGPCKAISPVFERFSNSAEFEGVDFYKVDVDDQELISQEVGIRAMPTFISFNDGQVTDRVIGANPQAVQKLLKQSAAVQANL